MGSDLTVRYVRYAFALPRFFRMFYELMRRRGPFCFYAFDLLWLDGTDLRGLALSGREALLRKLLPGRRTRSGIWSTSRAARTCSA